MPSDSKSLHEEFTSFFEEPTRVKLRNLLKRNFGETNNLDFKQEWLSFSKVAHHMLAMANSGGGCIVFGIAEDTGLTTVGLSEVKDRADAEKKFRCFCRRNLNTNS